MNTSTTSAQYFMEQYDLAFQISPIILVNGIATGVEGRLLPIMNITNPNSSDRQNKAQLPRYLIVPGSTLISQAVGMYPFANQAVAANATIQNPLTISLVMIAPVNQPGGFLTKMQRFSALQQALQQHNALGGMYIVATPAFVYQNLLLTNVSDATPEVSIEGDKQAQTQYQFDFVQPILTVQGAQAAQAALMQRITNGTQINGTPTVSGNPNSSPANAPGVTGALGNVIAALSAFGGTL